MPRQMLNPSCMMKLPVYTFAFAACGLAFGQTVSKPVYRVATEQATTAPAAAPQAQLVSATEPTSPFDFTLAEGEHPLMPCIRVAKEGLAGIESNIKDYEATFTKTERLDGKPGEQQHILLRVRHEPFSVYMKFINPYPGREALYVENQNEGNLVALDSGFKRRLGKINLDPNGMIAMRGQRHPITKCGIRNLTAELISIAEKDLQYSECEVKYNHTVKIAGRPVTMMEITHPTPRKNFRFHKAQDFRRSRTEDSGHVRRLLLAQRTRRQAGTRGTVHLYEHQAEQRLYRRRLQQG